jgi:uncharacterized membrane protein HdeD (DUF308 family)
MTKQAPQRSGNSVIYYTAIVLVTLCVIIGVYYLLPGVYHPFSTDTATHYYAHWKTSLGFLAGAVVFLGIARFTKPNTTQ